MTAQARRSPVLRVTAAVIQRGGEVLLARREAGSHLAGYWEFPGGKVEKGESPEDCLAREIREELHLEATVGRFIASSLHTYGDREIELLAYEVALADGPIVLNDHDEVRWAPIPELLHHKLAPADVPIAERLQANAAAQPAAAKKRS